MQDAQGWSLLAHAVRHGCSDVAQLILDKAPEKGGMRLGLISAVACTQRVRHQFLDFEAGMAGGWVGGMIAGAHTMTSAGLQRCCGRWAPPCPGRFDVASAVDSSAHRMRSRACTCARSRDGRLA